MRATRARGCGCCTAEIYIYYSMLVGAILASRAVAAVEPISLEAVAAVAAISLEATTPAVKLPREIAAKRQLSLYIYIYILYLHHP